MANSSFFIMFGMWTMYGFFTLLFMTMSYLLLLTSMNRKFLNEKDTNRLLFYFVFMIIYMLLYRFVGPDYYYIFLIVYIIISYPLYLFISFIAGEVEIKDYKSALVLMITNFLGIVVALTNETNIMEETPRLKNKKKLSTRYSTASTFGSINRKRDKWDKYHTSFI